MQLKYFSALFLIIVSLNSAHAHHPCTAPNAAIQAQRVNDPERITQLNEVVSDFLNKNYNTASKQSRITFNRVLKEENRIVHAELTLNIDVKSNNASAQVELQKLSYTLPENPCSHPEVSFSLQTRHDLSSKLNAEKFNELSRVLPFLISEFLKSSLTEKFHYPVEISNEWIRPSNPDQVETPLTEIEFSLSGAPDLGNLPQGMTPGKVSLVSLQANAVVALHELRLNGSFQLNPTGHMFQTAEGGANTYIDKILSRDPKTLDEILGYLQSADSAAGKIVEFLESI